MNQMETSISPTFKYFLRGPSLERIPLHSLTFSQCQLENWMQLNTKILKDLPRNPTIQGPQSLIHISLGWLFRSGSSRVSQDGKQDNNCLTSDAQKRQIPGRGYMLWVIVFSRQNTTWNSKIVFSKKNNHLVQLYKQKCTKNIERSHSFISTRYQVSCFSSWSFVHRIQKFLGCYHHRWRSAADFSSLPIFLLYL